MNTPRYKTEPVKWALSRADASTFDDNTIDAEIVDEGLGHFLLVKQPAMRDPLRLDIEEIEPLCALLRLAARNCQESESDDESKADDCDWIPWAGKSERPNNVTPDQLVEVKLRDGCMTKGKASGFLWKGFDREDWDIVAYRIAPGDPT